MALVESLSAQLLKSIFWKKYLFTPSKMPDTIIESVLTGKLDYELLIKWLNNELIEVIHNLKASRIFCLFSLFLFAILYFRSRPKTAYCIVVIGTSSWRTFCLICGTRRKGMWVWMKLIINLINKLCCRLPVTSFVQISIFFTSGLPGLCFKNSLLIQLWIQTIPGPI